MASTKKLTIGLTGGIGSGKSAAAACFEALGITVVDADTAARTVTQRADILEKIIQHFGHTFLMANGQLDRAAMRSHVFTYPTEKKWLETLLHPEIRAHIFQALKTAPSIYAILSAPLLMENNLDQYIDRTLVIDVPLSLQLIRASARDQCEQEIIEKIIASQFTREQRNTRADDIIDNSGDLEHLNQQILLLHEGYLKLAQTYTEDSTRS